MVVTLVGAACVAVGVAAAIAAVRPALVAGPHLRWRDPDTAALGELRLGVPPGESSVRMGRWLLARSSAALALGVVAAATGMPIVLGAAIGAAAPSLWLRLRLDGARRRARRSSTHLMRSVYAALSSGASVADALRRGLAGCTDRLAARPLEDAMASFSVGAALDRALLDASASVGDHRIRAALETLALGIGERLPIERVAALAGRVSESLVFDEQLDDEVQARASGLRAQVWLVALLIPALSAYLLLTVPTLASSVGSGVGRTVLLPAAAAFEILGIVLSRRIVGVLR